MTPRSGPQLRLVPDTAAPAVPLTFDEVFARYASYVASIGLRLLGRDSEIDDLIQDVFVHALHGLRDRQSPEGVKAWLAVVTVRVATKRLRRRRIVTFLGFREDTPAWEPRSKEGSPEDHATLSRIYAVLDGLPAADRVAWSLRRVEGETLERVAVLSNCSLATAKRRIARAQMKIDEAFHET